MCSPKERWSSRPSRSSPRAPARVTWVEQIDGADHVFVAEISQPGLTHRVDLGAGSTPSFASDGVVSANLQDTSVWRTPLAAPQPAKLTDGQSPTAVGSSLCLFRIATAASADGTENSVDQLRCLALDGAKIVRDDLVTSAAGGVLTLRVAVAGGVQAVAYQTEGDEGMQVGFATLRCAK